MQKLLDDEFVNSICLVNVKTYPVLEKYILVQPSTVLVA
jgi:hypothetical protein